ncbi:MAG: cytochrome C [Candidatus Competibacter sp.]|nr:cytochrome C [Candidatus Competibacter sp.]
MKPIDRKAFATGFRASVVAVCAALATSPAARADGAEPARGGAGSTVRQGFAIAPVPLDLRGKSRALVGLGSYIVNAQGACNDCHTAPAYAPGGDPFKGQPEQINTVGYLGGGVSFGPIVSRNLTPDKNGLPGGASLDEFVEIMRTGVDPDQAHPQLGPFLQVMPWPVYQKMTDTDLRAVYEYLRAIPCVEGNPGIPDAPAVGRCG